MEMHDEKGRRVYGRAKGAAAGRAAVREDQAKHDVQVLDVIRSCRKDGMSFRQITAYLDLSHDSPGRARGMFQAESSQWSAIAVKRILDRNAAEAEPGQLDIEDAIQEVRR